MAIPYEEIFNEMSPERQKKIKARAAEIEMELLTLRELRETVEKTQKDVAGSLKVGQDSVSRLENRDDMKVSTLRGYVEALGGEMKILVNVPGRPPVSLRLGDIFASWGVPPSSPSPNFQPNAEA
jgi:predicted  nucleic acid-binding Zn-ribbon protein